MRDMRLRSFPSDTPMDAPALSGTCYLYDQKETRHFHPGDRLYAEGEMSRSACIRIRERIDLTGRYRSRHLLGRLYLKEGMHPAFAGESGTYRIERFSSEMKQSLKETFSALHWIPVRLSIPDDAPLRRKL